MGRDFSGSAFRHAQGEQLVVAAIMMKWILILPIKAYQKFISPALPPACRFQPTCSHYGYEAIKKYGLIKGGWLAIRRIGRCHPFHPGGYDPVP